MVVPVFFVANFSCPRSGGRFPMYTPGSCNARRFECVAAFAFGRQSRRVAFPRSVGHENAFLKPV
eukprot:4234856-Lingulodinium_polyedra.AAC.1